MQKLLLRKGFLRSVLSHQGWPGVSSGRGRQWVGRGRKRQPRQREKLVQSNKDSREHSQLHDGRQISARLELVRGVD